MERSFRFLSLVAAAMVICCPALPQVPSVDPGSVQGSQNLTTAADIPFVQSPGYLTREATGIWKWQTSTRQMFASDQTIDGYNTNFITDWTNYGTAVFGHGYQAGDVGGWARALVAHAWTDTSSTQTAGVTIDSRVKVGTSVLTGVQLFGTYSAVDTDQTTAHTFTQLMGTNSAVNMYLGTISKSAGALFDTVVYTSPTITENKALWARLYDAGTGGSITNNYILYGDYDPTTSSGTTTITNNYGLYLKPMNGAHVTNAWQVYSAGTALAYYAGPVQSAGTIQAIRNISANTTAAATDYTFICDTSAASVTLTLPASPETGRVYAVKKTSALNSLTVDGNGHNIDGAATDVISALDGSATFQYDGSAWWVIQ